MLNLSEYIQYLCQTNPDRYANEYIISPNIKPYCNFNCLTTTQFRIVEFRKGADGKDLFYTERERERECRTSEYLFSNCNSRNDKEFRGYDKRQTYIRKNIGSFNIIGLANHGKDNEYDLFEPKINGKLRFKRILIR